MTTNNEDFAFCRFDDKELLLDNLNETLLREKALRELGETPEVRSRCLQEMRLWLMEGSGKDIKTSSRLRLELATVDANKFLLRFLRAQKFDITKAQGQLQRYLLLRSQQPQWFASLQETDANVLQLLKHGFMTVLPRKDSQGRIVVLNWAAVFDPAKHTKVDQMRCIMMTLDTLSCFEEVQICGLSHIIYGPNLTLAHASLWSPSEIPAIIAACEKSMPLRHQKIHFVKLPLCLYAALEFGKLFLSHKMKSRIELLSSIDKLDSHWLPHEITTQEPTQDGTEGLREETTRKWIQTMLKVSNEELANIASLQLPTTSLCKNDADLLHQSSRKKSKWLLLWPF